MRFSDNEEFKRLLDEKKQDILQRTSDGVQETENFNRLFSLLKSCRAKFEEKDFRLILISKDDLRNLCLDADKKAFDLFNNSDLHINRTVHVNENLEILDKNNDHFLSDNNDARRYFCNLTLNNNLIAFLVAPNSIVNYFIDGKDYGGGVFYTRAALNSYEELKTIDKLMEVLDDYRVNLTRQEIYSKFFIPKASLCALRSILNTNEDEKTFIKNNKHLLRNRPEDLFQQDMCSFINSHMRVTIIREYLLGNQERPDIVLTDEEGQDLYFIEVKWVGESIGQKGNKYGTKYSAKPRINQDAVEQSLGYISQFYKENKNIKIGYLAVFDARKEDFLPDTGVGITSDKLHVDLKKYFSRFVKIPDFRIKNENPK